MDIKFSKDSGEHQQQAVSDDKGKQNLLLVVLLVLVCGFGYVYFFTGLIKPQTEQKQAEAPAPQVVKKPLPTGDGQPVKAETAAAAAPAPAAAVTPDKQEPAKVAAEQKKTDTPKPADKKSSPEPAKTAEKKPAAVAEKKPAAVAEKKPAAVAEKKPAAAAEKKPAAVAEKKPAAVAEKKPAAVAEKKPAAVAEKKPAAASDAKLAGAKKPADAKADAAAAPRKESQKPERKAVAAVAEPASTPAGWTVLVGNYMLEEALVSDLVRVRKAGLEASVIPGRQKKTRMNRLMLAEFADRDSAQAQLDKLKRHTSDAFIIDSAGKHVVYAGSYLLDARAESEKDRLAAAGFNLTLRRADVSIASKSLTAGVYPDKKAAEEVRAKLKAAGINSAVIHK